MNYYDEKEFTTKTKISRSKLYRFYKKNEELKTETKLQGKRLYPENHLKYFSSEIMFDENKLLQLENQSMRNLIDCLVDKDSLQYRLWQMEWDFFFTVAYKTDRNKKSCFRQINAVFEEILCKYGDKTEIRLFFTTEPFTNRVGFHNHFVLYVGDVKLHQEIVVLIQNYFSYDKTDVKKYDRYKAGLFYASKEGLVNEDWDILGNNLGKEKFNNEN
ncbi:hypothetical protein FCR2A7T_20030 [Flavobacterium cauense R2A-7]|uniref:Bacteriophage replication gene A protein n=1 Tax=Flavobacterium cauense R2A-7 TaxID=1341154 RepID=V6RYY7_9FLAO|nr:hypothetical protein [Flavobacterium cauense]ESU19389.1 hypothetical protein FCR2A7T_20030 [Flavobacterium cauense R2A-7]KGO80353.1 hypothetical protein Q762_12005 [Flavobacterium cauense R2A-7]TWI09357.1 hypothetical protein IP98_02519 [Flavobacterium cauense R2A-7]